MRKEVMISVIMVLAIVGSVMFMFKNIADKASPITGLVASSDVVEVPDSVDIQDTRPISENKNYVVDIKVFKFYPEELRIRVGDSVTWVNYDKAKHKIYTGIHPDGSILIDSGFLQKDQSYTKTFDTAGVYEYWSAAWPYVQGKLIVEMPVRN